MNRINESKERGNAQNNYKKSPTKVELIFIQNKMNRNHLEN